MARYKPRAELPPNRREPDRRKEADRQVCRGPVELEAEEPRCPACKAPLAAARGTKDPKDRPSPGDFSVCLYCSAALRFTEDLGLRLLTQQELDEAPAQMRQALAIADSICRRRKGQP